MTMNCDNVRGRTLDPAIDAELAILASIETALKEQLREQFEVRRKMAREPHVLRLAELHQQSQMRTLFSGSRTTEPFSRE
jgi:predicted methyltransferase